MANPAVTPQSDTRRSGLERGVDKIWRFFTSVRNAIYEISFLTLLVLIGTLRGSVVPEWLADHIPVLQPLVDRWYAWDVFRSPIFAGTLAVIAVAIIICTLNRVPQIWAQFANPTIRTSMGFINGAETAAEYSLEATPEGSLENLRDVLSKRRYRVLTEKHGDATHIYADKNRFGNFGTFPFHLGLILLLVGGIIASTWGFRDEEFVIAEGRRGNVGHGTGLSVELHRVTDTWAPVGSPIDYSSEVTVYKDGNPVKTGTIQVNHPMSVGDVTFYQGSLGQTAEITLQDRGGNIIFSGPIALGLDVSQFNPEAMAGRQPLQMIGSQLVVISRDARPNVEEVPGIKLQPGQMWVGLTTQEQGVVVTQGQPQQLGEYTVTFEREGNFTLLQVGYNPGIPVFIIAALFMVGGLMVTFYFPHRRIRGILSPSVEGSTLAIAPLAKRDFSGKREFFSILEKLNETTGATPKVRAPKNEGDYEFLYKHSQSSKETQ